jgi:hypothetical protein
MTCSKIDAIKETNAISMSIGGAAGICLGHSFATCGGH